MADRPRIVVDTNVLASRLLVPRSVPAGAVRRVVGRGTLLASEETMVEFARVLARPKFDAYVTVDERQRFLRLLGGLVEMVPILHRVQVCRDPKDDKFLEVAVNGEAGVIGSGDPDLVNMASFRGIPIVTPAAYLAVGG